MFGIAIGFGIPYSMVATGDLPCLGKIDIVKKMLYYRPYFLHWPTKFIYNSWLFLHKFYLLFCLFSIENHGECR